jgi:tRNA pseudouridine55 synthase
MPDCANAGLRAAESRACPKCRPRPGQRWVAPKRDVPLSGILNVDKPPDLTSHDVVAAVRRVAGQRKVGHAGTLDPMATGVLLVCLGQATRVAEYLMASHKRYRATIVLGTSTDTYDAEGEILTSDGRIDFDQAKIEAALATFVGRIQQVPPMYSALKRDGEPLYKLARQGKTVAREPREVDIAELRLLDWTPPSLIIEVDCSSGTYIRSLAHDLGQRLDSGAHLARLVRLSSGRFSLEEATSLERVEEIFEHGQESHYLLPIDEALLDWPALIVGAQDAQRIVQGQAVQGEPPVDGGGVESFLCRAYNIDGDFVAIMAYDPTAALWRPKKVFGS